MYARKLKFSCCNFDRIFQALIYLKSKSSLKLNHWFRNYGNLKWGLGQGAGGRFSEEVQLARGMVCNVFVLEQRYFI